ncbi:MAG: TonB-dependent receptor, partial [Aquificota bacterium]
MKRKLLLLAVLSTATFAQEERLEDVVISATRQELEKKQAPQPVESLKREDLHRFSVRENLRDLFLFDSSLFTLRSRGRSFLSIRGFNADKVLVLIDGRRLTGEVDRDFEIDRITLDRVERVEIVKGPASVLYGTDALGGVINIITREPLKPEFSFSTKYGMYSSGGNPEEKNLSFYAYTGRFGNFNLGVFGRLTQAEPYRLPNRTTLADDRDLKSFGISAFYYLDKSAKSKLRFDYDYLTHRDITTTFHTTHYRRSINDNKRQNLSLGLDLNRRDWRLFLRGYASIYDKDFEQRREDNNRLLQFDIADRRTYVIEGYLSKDLFERHRFTVGGEGRRESFETTRIRSGSFKGTVTREGITQAKYKVDIDYYALYVQDEWFISDRLFLVAGLRYDDSDKFESDLSPRVGLTYSLLPDLRLKANYAHGFKSPTPRDLFIYFSQPGYVVVGNPNLKSEKTDGVDLGLEKDFGRQATLKVNLFYTRAKDLIETCLVNTPGCPPLTLNVPSPPPNAQVFTYRNVGKAEFKGVELSGFFAPLNWLGGRLSYTYLEARDEEEDKRLLQRPRHRLVGEVSVRPLEKTRISLAVEHTSD